ncbi:MAG: aminoacyl-tRNA hydrolase [Streptococcaceae bacterium]|jgi:PTH1 family peptidyl-tRNA hydrolase|nr:aminoacyl-tRNA hydrolase [Streptococcaceae bacterium]
MTKMIVGLGNIGPKYENTKHNIGFMTVDELASRHQVTFKEDKVFKASISEYFEGTQKVILVKPTTFMNESGKAVGPLSTYFNIALEDLVVIQDDLDMDVGKIRLRQKGGSGGQNGIKSIISHLGTQEFQRVKVGIGRPPKNMSVTNHVLSRFQGDQAIEIEIVIKKAADALEYWSSGGTFIDTMNKFNG